MGFQFCQSADWVSVIELAERFSSKRFTMLLNSPDFSLGETAPLTISNPLCEAVAADQSSCESMAHGSAAKIELRKRRGRVQRVGGMSFMGSYIEPKSFCIRRWQPDL
jgi:hypothetical protein